MAGKAANKREPATADDRTGRGSTDALREEVARAKAKARLLRKFGMPVSARVWADLAKDAENAVRLAARK